MRAVGKLDQIRRAACREDAERRFSPRAMADSYERIYEELVLAGSDGRVVDISPIELAATDRTARGAPPAHVVIAGS